MVSFRFFLERFRELIQSTVWSIEKVLKLLNCVDHDNENEKIQSVKQLVDDVAIQYILSMNFESLTKLKHV